MSVRDRLRRLLNRAAPLACSFCEGGSGSNLDPESGRLTVCEHCHGTGREAYPAALAETMVGRRLHRQRRSGSDKRPTG